ncbi:MAG: shikimate dehydrogenase [Bacteroidota bacterium]|nr:shikimate dehydrogenase [Bacteroidota bacterium]
MDYFAVAGKPVSHSRSPLIFNYLFDYHNLNAKYLRLAADNSEEIIEFIKDIHLKGLNLTSPFKESLNNFIELISKGVKETGAVNFILNKKKRLLGFNTDIAGVCRIIREHKIDLNNKYILILGAGGAAKAVLSALKYFSNNFAFKIYIINRSPDKAKDLVERFCSERFDVHARNFSELVEYLKFTDILFNTIPGNFEIIDNSMLHSNLTIIDSNYHNSYLMKHAEYVKCKYIGGMEWLVNQALPAFYKAYKIKPEKDLILNYLKEHPDIIPPKNIVLIGFTGSGKTTIGKIVADKLDYLHIDIDREIEINQNRSISEIFKTEGDDYFRRLEFRYLKKLKKIDKAVISCGGGILSRAGSAKVIKTLGMRFWLYSPLDTCLERTTIEIKPLLVNQSQFRTKYLFERRRKSYFKNSDVIILNNNTLEAAADRIILEYKNIL